MASPGPTASPAPPTANTVLVRGGKVVLFFAFAFAVMADPVSSVALRSRPRCGRSTATSSC